VSVDHAGRAAFVVGAGSGIGPNDAGLVRMSTLDELGEDEWDLVLDTNLKLVVDGGWLTR